MEFTGKEVVMFTGNLPTGKLPVNLHNLITGKLSSITGKLPGNLKHNIYGNRL